MTLSQCIALVICTASLLGFGALGYGVPIVDDGVPLAPERLVPAPEPFAKTLPQFRLIRSELINLIAAAQSRVWIVSDYINDGEIVSALYLAQYRHIDVRVVLGPERARTYQSRLGYLKRQGIPVYLRPANLSFSAPTSVLIDQRFFTLDADLDYLSAQRQFSLRLARRAAGLAFEESVRKIFQSGTTPEPRPLVRAGRPPAQWQSDSNDAPARTRVAPSQPNLPYDGEADGSYNYNRSGAVTRGGNQGLPTKLPKTPAYSRPRSAAELPRPALADDRDESVEAR